MAGFLNYKTNPLFKTTQQFLGDKLQHITSIDLPPETDPSILSLLCVHDLLNNHSIILSALLEMIPEESVNRVYNNTNTDITPKEAIKNLIEQQNRANITFRHSEYIGLLNF